MIVHAHEATKDWKRDGDLDAMVVHVADTGAEIGPMVFSNQLGRVPVGVQIIRKNKACDVVMTAADQNKITVEFTAPHADVNLRIW
jgi:hypothetical protein